MPAGALPRGATAALSPSARHALREASLWAAVGLGALLLVCFFDDLRSALGPGGKGARRDVTMFEASQERPGFAREVRLSPTGAGTSCSTPLSTTAPRPS